MAHSIDSVARGAPRRQRGIAIIEFAFLAPLLLLILFSTIEYGWLFIKVQQLGQAARIGARMAVTQPATTAAVDAAISQYMAEAGLSDAGCLVTITPSDVASAPTGAMVKVTVSVPCENLELTGFPLPKPTTLSASTTMAKEGPPVP